MNARTIIALLARSRRTERLAATAAMDAHTACQTVLDRQIRRAAIYGAVLLVFGVLGTLAGVEPAPWAGPGGSAPTPTRIGIVAQ